MGPVERAAVLTRWMDVSSPSEQDRMERAERMVTAAIEAHPAFDGYRSKIKVYAKGSYANRTNVRADSDVDVVVENRDVMYFAYNPRSSAPTPDPNHVPYEGRWDDPAEWRAEVVAAMVNKFGSSDVDTSGKVAITIAEVPGSRPSADVVPSFQFARYDRPDRSITHDGSRVFATDGSKIDNFPAQQKANGIAKDNETSGRYKKYARALKNAENVLSSAGVIDDLPSYFMECLMWNVPSGIMRLGSTHDEGFRHALVHLIANLHESDYNSDDWEEPNRLKWLFKGHSKWTPEQGFELAFRTFKFLGYTT